MENQTRTPINVTTLRQAEDNLEQIFQLVRKPAWLTREAKLIARYPNLPMLPPHHLERHDLELKIADGIRHYRSSRRYLSTRSSDTYDVAAFSHSFVRLLKHIPHDARHAIAGKVRQALTGDQSMRPLRFELDSMAHLIGSGFRVLPIDYYGVEGQSHDYRITCDGGELDVECKHIDSGTGMTIPKATAYALFNEVLGLAKKLSASLSGTMLRITTEGRLEGEGFGGALATISMALRDGPGTYPGPGLEVAFGPLNAGVLDAVLSATKVTTDTSKKEWQEARDQLGLKHSASILLHSADGEPSLLSISSQREDRVANTVFQRLSGDAKKQLGQSDTGALLVELSSLDQDDNDFFVGRSADDRLVSEVKELFRKRPNLVAIGFVPGRRVKTQMIDPQLWGRASPMLIFPNTSHYMAKSPVVDRYLGASRQKL